MSNTEDELLAEINSLKSRIDILESELEESKFDLNYATDEMLELEKKIEQKNEEIDKYRSIIEECSDNLRKVL